MRVRFPTAKILELQWVRIPISVELGATFRSSRTGRMYSQIVSRLNFPNYLIESFSISCRKHQNLYTQVGNVSHLQHKYRYNSTIKNHYKLIKIYTTIITHHLSHLILLNTLSQYISTHPPSYKYHDHLTFTS